MSFEAASAIPEAFLTAYHALKWLGGLGPNKRVLIHAGVEAFPLFDSFFMPHPSSS